MPVGIYACRCDGRVDAVVDMESALVDAREQAAVVRVVDDLFDPEVRDRIIRDIHDAELDAVVLAGHSVDHFAKSLSAQQLKQSIIDAGLNPNRVISANWLEQVALPHRDDPEGATIKARALLKVAMLRASMGEPVKGAQTEPRQSVMILGVTTEALVAAQRLLQLGFSVILADRGSGSARAASRDELKATIGYVFGHPNAEFVDGVKLVDGQGWVGDYELVLDSEEGRVSFRVGGILMARPDNEEWIAELRTHFKVDIDDDGRARSIQPATHPAETIDPGIMVVPVRGSGDSVKMKVAAADSAAMALVLKLSQEHTTHYFDVSEVDDSLCGGCASCVKTCAFGACSIDPESGLSVVDPRRCRGCGKCVVSCPVGARDIVNSPHDYLLGAIRSLAEVPVDGEKVIGFLCGGCGYPAGDSAGHAVDEGGESYPASFLPVRIPCGGRLDTLYVLEAFKQGFDGVAVYRCREGHCHNLIGNLDMDRRINLLRTVLRSRNLDDGRLRIVDISPFEGEEFAKSVNGVFSALSSMTNGKGGIQ